MIEIVYKEDVATEEVNIKLPRNIKQVGACGINGRKVYIEDYAAGFIKNPPQSEDDFRYGVLLGEIKRSKSDTYVFVRGAVETSQKREVRFDDAVWTEIYEEIKQYFSEFYIVGWFLNAPSMEKEGRMKFQKTHLDNFAGNDKICFFVNRSEHDEAIYTYDSGMMQKRHGYYVYYEKNPEMQNYMADKKTEKRVENTVISGSMNGRIAEEKRNVVRHSRYSMVVSVGMLIATVAFMANYTNKIHFPYRLKVEEINDSTAKVEMVNGNVETTIYQEDSTDSTEAADSTEADTVSAPADTVPENTEQPEADTEYNYYIVRQGDSLSKICTRIYGSEDRKTEVMEINGISDENKIYVGQKIILP